jgi:hypothetical protein|nr:MAG TPA: hypothetical protein [Caudoviricetes sp.]
MKKIVKVVMKDSKSVLEASQNVEFDDVMKAFLAMDDDEREEVLDYWEEMRHGND